MSRRTCTATSQRLHACSRLCQMQIQTANSAQFVAILFKLNSSRRFGHDIAHVANKTSKLRSAFLYAANLISQFMVGASRQRAAPRSQFISAAFGNIGCACTFGAGRSLARLSSRQFSSSARLLHLHSKGFHCGLTRRSTGPIAAGRHLGYKSLAQIPARRNRPG